MTAVPPDIPKMSTADATAEILDGFEAGEEEIYVGEMARGLAAGLAKDPKGGRATARQRGIARKRFRMSQFKPEPFNGGKS